MVSQGKLDEESKHETEAKCDVILTLRHLHDALIDDGLIHDDNELDISCWTLLKIVTLRSFQLFQDQFQNTVMEIQQGVQEIADISCSKNDMKQAVLTPLLASVASSPPIPSMLPTPPEVPYDDRLGCLSSKY